MGKVSVAVKEDHCRAETSGFEAVIIGCGIAGASVAYFLAQRGMTDILILERETQPGYHATGRSAAVLVEFDMVRPILQLKLLGARFLRNPPAGFSENPLLQQSGILILFKEPLWQHVVQMIPDLRRWGVAVDVLDREETVKRMPVVSPENFDGALLLPQDGRIDVNELLWSYLKQARAGGARLLCNEEVSDIMVERGRCVGVRTSSGTYRSRWVINAAGAWACLLYTSPSPRD